MKKNLVAVAVSTGLSTTPGLAADSLSSSLNSAAAKPDTTPPKVSVFKVPATVNSTVVPITAFVASDNQSLAGYLVTQTAARPAASSSGWSTTRPQTIKLTGDGSQTLYAWAKDQAGNVSTDTVSAPVLIDTIAPTVTDFSVTVANSPKAAAGSPPPPPLTVATFTVNDNVAVTGYLITEMATPVPTLQTPGWQPKPPANYKPKAKEVKTLYAWARDAAGNISIAKSATVTANQPAPAFNLEQTLSDGAQRTTLAFSGLALMTGNLEAQSFFPPGKVADYTGFQYLRDNDPDHMGHNTSFLTRIANNVIYLLNDDQFKQLQNLATAQLSQIEEYGYQRFPLMEAFRKFIDDDLPTGATDLNLNAVKQASRALYRIDGQISFDRALLYANIINSLTAEQKSYLDGMKGKGWKSWPNVTDSQIQARMQQLPRGTAVAVMTYASDLFSWYAGSIAADVYFCPERHGTYYGGFYIKDAPAIGHEGYSINEQLTAEAGAALSDSSKGYVNDQQAALMSSLVATQKDNLYAGATNIVQIRTEIATLLRSLLTPGADSETVNAQVLELSERYGELDGENNYHYVLTFSQVYHSLTNAQMAKLTELRQSILSGVYADGTPFDFSVATAPYLYSSVITDSTVLTPYLTAADQLFFEPN